jgi:hypothetical protein
MALKIGNRTLTAGGETFDILSGSVSGSVDEVIIPSGTKETAPLVRAYYNPRVELSAEVIGDATGETTCEFSGTTFKITSVTKTQSAEDVVKSSISGIFYGTTFSIT